MKASVRIKFDMIVEPVEVDGNTNDNLSLPEALAHQLKDASVTFAKMIGNLVTESETIGGQLEVVAKPYDPEHPSVEHHTDSKSVN